LSREPTSAQMQNMTAVDALSFMELGHETLRLIETMPKPVIAAINGFALGGGTEISLACDVALLPPKIAALRSAGNTHWSDSRLGRDGSVLPRIIGMGRAKELILGGGHQITATARL